MRLDLYFETDGAEEREGNGRVCPDGCMAHITKRSPLSLPSERDASIFKREGPPGIEHWRVMK